MLEHILNTTVTSIDGRTRRIADYRGDVLLIVNTASKCGFTPQLGGLEALHQDYSTRGLRVLGFPSDQFAQELDSEAEVAAFCRGRYGVSFPMHEIVKVNGPDAHPLFQKLREMAPGVLGTRGVKWNYTKFLVDLRTGRVRRYAPATTPEELRTIIEAVLPESRRATGEIPRVGAA